MRHPLSRSSLLRLAGVFVILLLAIVVIAIGPTRGTSAPSTHQPTALSNQQETEAKPYLFLDGFVRETPMNVSAGYVTIRNNTDTDDALLGASATWAGRIELHNIVADEHGTLGMKQVNDIVLPAQKETLLKPGGYHLMIYELKEPLKLNETRDITLTLKHGGAHVVPFAVQPISYQGERAESHTKQTHAEHSHTGHQH